MATSGRVAECGGGLGGGEGGLGLDAVGDAVGAQPGQGVLRGVAVDTEPGGDGGGADRGVGVQQLGGEGGDLVARDLVPGARGPAAAGRGGGPPGAARLERPDSAPWPVVDPARLDPGLGQGRVALVDVPGVRGHPDQRRALPAVQEVTVVLLRRERGDRLAQEVGVDLLTVVQPRTRPLRVDRGREALGLIRLEMGVAVDAEPLLRGEVRQGAHAMLPACSDHRGVPP
ncbi:hypothetical protein [Streptomyces sp. NPDC050255]|uniref:hypothetical protein n=1 Tax=Streptomyces sp. NPDC050255 TaxID=3365606 RepID=UPI0037AC0215